MNWSERYIQEGKPGYYVAASESTIIFVRVRRLAPYMQLVTFVKGVKIPHPKQIFKDEHWFSNSKALHTDYKRVTYKQLIAFVAMQRLTS